MFFFNRESFIMKKLGFCIMVKNNTNLGYRRFEVSYKIRVIRVIRFQKILKFVNILIFNK